MRDNDFDNRDSWSIAFFVTSVCFFIFIFFLRFIDNSSPRFFLAICITSFLCGCLSLVESIWLRTKSHLPDSD